MEKLTPLSSSPISGWHADTRLACDVDQLISDGYLNDDNLQAMAQYQPGLIEACDIIRDNFTHRHIDLHHDNMMRRGEVLVITDPVC